MKAGASVPVVCAALSWSWAFAIPAPAAATASSPALGDLSKVGAVHFPTTGDPDVKKEFERGLALLHSFFHEEARLVFTSVAEKDPGLAEPVATIPGAARAAAVPGSPTT